jgi:polyisoprenoid-binding protein YceI
MMRNMAILLVLSSLPAWSAESFVLETGHTFPSFEIRHQGVSTMRGKFNRSQGRVVLDPEGQGGQIEVIVDATSGDTGHDGLNQKLLGSNFFNAGRFPDIRFSSSNIEYRDGKPVRASGQLTMLGVSRTVDLEIRDYGCTRQFLTLRHLCGADAHMVIKRSDFGMNYGIPLIGDEVKLAIEVEGLRE